jgi:hypothetical protein
MSGGVLPSMHASLKVPYSRALYTSPRDHCISIVTKTLHCGYYDNRFRNPSSSTVSLPRCQDTFAYRHVKSQRLAAGYLDNVTIQLPTSYVHQANLNAAQNSSRKLTLLLFRQSSQTRNSLNRYSPLPNECRRNEQQVTYHQCLPRSAGNPP